MVKEMLLQRRDELVSKYRKKAKHEFTIKNIDEKKPINMDQNEAIVEMESGASMEEQFFEVFQQTVKGMDEQNHKEVLIKLLEGYKEKVKSQGSNEINEEIIQKQIKMITLMAESSNQDVAREVKNISKQLQEISRLQSPKLGEKLHSQQLLECVLV